MFKKLHVKASGVIVGCLCVLSSGCLDTSCSYKVLKQEDSPDTKYVATVFESNCGATAPFAQHVLLREASESFDGEKVDNIVFTARGRSVAEVRWLDSRHIIIRRVPNRDDIFKELELFRGIIISYVSDWPTGSFFPRYGSPTDLTAARLIPPRPAS